MSPSIASTVNLHTIATIRRALSLSAHGPGRIDAHRALHHACRAALAQLIDGTNRVNRCMQRSPGVEIFLDHRQQVGVGAIVPVVSRLGDERVGERIVGRHAGIGVDGQAPLDKLAGGERDAAPVFERSEAVIGDKDGLHFFEVRVSVEGGVSAEKEVGDDADRPDIAKRQAEKFSLGGILRGDEKNNYTGLPWPVFLKISGAM